MTNPFALLDELELDDWLKLLPAPCLIQYASSPAVLRGLSSLPAGSSVSDLWELSDGDPLARPGARSVLRRAERGLKKTLRGRDIRGIRPLRSNWVIPDCVGFTLEGKSRSLSRRTTHICEVLGGLADGEDRGSNQRRALLRLVELIAKSGSHPTWIYWYSPQTVSLARATSHETLFEVNQLASRALQALGLDVTIATWDEAVSVVMRRLPLSILSAHSPTRRSKLMLGKLENCGITTLGGLTVLSKDSLDVLRGVQLTTLEACAHAIRGGYQTLVT